LFVAVSGTPIKEPPKLDAQGNPIFEADADDDKNSDHRADGIAVVDVAQRRFVRKIEAGSDPEQFAVSADGTYLRFQRGYWEGELDFSGDGKS
jgi:hypothetical protein